MQVIAIRYGGSFGLDYIGVWSGHILGRDLRPARWKTRRGAENYAKRKGYEIVE